MAENFGQVIFESLAKGAEKYGTEIAKEDQQRKQNALNIFQATLQQQQANMERERHRQMMIQGAQNFKLSNLNIQKASKELYYLSNPQAKVEEEIKANTMRLNATVDNLKGLGIDVGGGLSGLPPGLSVDFGGGVKFAPPVQTQYKPTAEEIKRQVLGDDGYRKYLTDGKVQQKSLTAENQFIYSFLKTTDPENADERFFNALTQSKTNTPDAIAVRLLTGLGGGALDAFDMSDPGERAALAEIIQTVVSGVTGEEYDLSKLGDTLNAERKP